MVQRIRHGQTAALVGIQIMRDIDRRIDAVERGMTALQRAYLLLQRGIPPEQWPDAELESYCGEMPELERLSDEQLEALIIAAPGQVEHLLAEMLKVAGNTNAY